jgi:hypothetical protein
MLQKRYLLSVHTFYTYSYPGPRFFTIICVQFFMSWFDYSLGGPLGSSSAKSPSRVPCRDSNRGYMRPQARHSPTELRHTPMSYAAPHLATSHPSDRGVGESRGTGSLRNFVWDVYVYLPARTIPALTARRMRKNPSR